MEIYVEYAFLENFLFDGVLLFLALTATRVKPRMGKICLSASLGGVFALLFPLLRMRVVVGNAVKIFAGCLLVAVAFGRLKNRKEWGRYALSVVIFFCFSFGFGGTLLGVYSNFAQGKGNFYTAESPSAVGVFFGFALLSAISVWLIRKLQERKKLFQNLFRCRVYNGDKNAEADGFFDSGNLAKKHGLPVCFLSPDLAYELFGEGWIYAETHLKISTMAGEKTIPLLLGETEILDGKTSEKKQVYFALATNMIGKEYKVLLNAHLLGVDYEMDGKN